MEVERLPPYKGCAAHRAQTNCRSSCSGNNRRVFRLPRRSIKDASVARFASLSLSPHKPNSGDDPRKGAAAPFLVVLRGIVKGENRNSPLTILSFDRQRRFLSHMRKKAGLKHSLFWQDRKEWAVGDNLRLRRIRNGPTAQERMGLRRKKARLRRANKKPSQDKPTTVGRG